jgi:HMG (high mobility group) box
LLLGYNYQIFLCEFSESKSASDLLEAMYNGTFTVELTTEIHNVATPYIKDSESQPQSKRRLNLDKIAQPFYENDDNLKEMFGGKIPSFLTQQFDSSSTGMVATDALNSKAVARPKKTPSKRRNKRLPSLEKLEKITRPPNSFMIFAQEFRPKLSEEFPHCKNKDISVK